MSTLEETLESIKQDLIHLLDDIPPELKSDMNLKLALIWKSIKSLLVCQKDEIDTIHNLCGDIINMVSGSCPRNEIISCVEAISELSQKLGEIEPHTNILPHIVKSSKKTIALNLHQDVPQSPPLPTKPPPKPKKLSKQTIIMSCPPPQPPKPPKID